MASVLRTKTEVDQQTDLNTKINRDLTRGSWVLVDSESNTWFEDILCLAASDNKRDTLRRSHVSFVDPAQENDQRLDCLAIGDHNLQFVSRRTKT